MPEKDIIGEHPVLLAQEFRDDLSVLAAAGSDTMVALADHLRGVGDYNKLLDDKQWTRLAELTGCTINDLFKMFRPLRYICLVALREKTDPGRIVALLADRGILRDAAEDVKQRITDAASALQPAIELAEAEGAPRLPGLQIERITSRASVISQFENEFDLSDDVPSAYLPRVQKLHVYTTLRVSFVDDEHDPITLALSESGLKQLSRWLEFSQVQQQALKEHVMGEATNVRPEP